MEFDNTCSIAAANKWSPLTFFLLFNILLSCAVNFLTLISSTERFQNGMCAFYFCATPEFQTGRRAEPRLVTQIKVFSAQTDIPSSLPYSVHPLSFPPVLIKQRKLSLAGCVAHRLVHTTGRTSLAPCLSASCLDPVHMDSPNTGGDYLTTSCALWSPGSQTHNWRESVESKSGFSCGAPQVMTGLHWHLLTCSAGLPGLDEVFAPLIFFYPPVVFFFLTNCGGQAKGQREPLDSRSGMSLMSSQSLRCASWGWQGALLGGIPLCPPGRCWTGGSLDTSFSTLGSHITWRSSEERRPLCSAEGAENNASFFLVLIIGLFFPVWMM